jgi:hypothetical protein
LDRNDRFMLRKLQHTKRFLLRSHHFLFVTSPAETEWERGQEWHCACDQNIIIDCFVTCETHTSAYIS